MALDALDEGLSGDTEPAPAGPLGEFETEIRAAFPAEDWTPERVMAMKEAIKLCVAADEAGEYGEKPPPKKGDAGLALIFGAPKKGK